MHYATLRPPCWMRRASTISVGRWNTPLTVGYRIDVMHLLLPAALLFLATSLAGGMVSAEKDAIDTHRHDLQEIEQRVQTLEEDLAARRGSRAVLLAELEQYERDIADLARAGHQLKDMIRSQEELLADLHSRLLTDRTALAEERTALAGLLRSAYASGRDDRIRLLLDQEDLGRLSRIMSYYGYLNRYRVARLDDLALRASRLEALTREATEETARLAQLALRQDNTRDRLAQAQSLRTHLLEDLEQTISSAEERVGALRLEVEGLRSLLVQLELQAAALPEAEVSQAPIGRLRGQLVWPIPAAQFIARFGGDKGDAGQRWDGVLIAASEGTEVRAVHNGRVVYSDWLRGFGLLTIIDHDEGYMTLYGHNQTLLKEPGEWVAPGDLIALSGASGGLRSPGLYFAIRHRGKPLDPQRWCRAPGGADGADGAGYLQPDSQAEHLAESPIQQPERSASVTYRFDVCRTNHRFVS